MAGLKAFAPYLQGAATVLSVASNERAARSDARQLKRMAGDTRATSQRAAAEERRKARYLDSRARAVAASSGAGGSDMDVLNARAGIQAEGEYRALTRMYEGDTEARGLELYAHERQQEARGKSIATILDSASTFAEKYGDAEVLPKRKPVNSRDLGTAYSDFENAGLGSGRYA